MMGFCLTPAYDLLATLIVMPEDNEELALTINGKKRKLQRKDFEKAMLASGISEKVIGNIANKFRKALAKWFKLIDCSFLPTDMKKKYKHLIINRVLMIK